MVQFTWTTRWQCFVTSLLLLAADVARLQRELRDAGGGGGWSVCHRALSTD